MKKLVIALLFVCIGSINAQSSETYVVTAEDYIYEGYTKGKSGDLYGAIKDYTKAIQINPNSFVAYNNRGLSKLKLKDFKGAIADYTKAIEIDPNKEISYSHRAMAKSALNDEYGAIADTNKAIELDPSKAVNYYGRGTSKYQLGDYNGACEDAKKAIKLGLSTSVASPLIDRACKENNSQSSSNDDNESLTTIITKIEGKIKDKPEPLGNIISYIKPNIKLKAIGIEGSYWKIFFNGEIAYISDIYIYQSETTSDFKNSIPNKYKNFAVEVTTKTLSKLRYEPSSASDIKMRIPKDEIIYVIGFKKPFWKIFYKGEEGYLYDGLYFDNSYKMMKFKY